MYSKNFVFPSIFHSFNNTLTLISTLCDIQKVCLLPTVLWFRITQHLLQQCQSGRYRFKPIVSLFSLVPNSVTLALEIRLRLVVHQYVQVQ